MTRALAVFLIFSFITQESARASVQCISIFSDISKIVNLDSRLQNTISELAQLRLRLDLAQAQGQSSSPFFVAMSANYTAKETQFIKYLEQQGLMSKSDFQIKLKEEIFRYQNSVQKPALSEKERVSEENKRRLAQENQILQQHMPDGRHAVFNHVRPGSYKIDPEANHVITIAKPFEMMATATTQTIWKQVAELANRNLKEENISQIEVDPSNQKGETHPVQNISAQQKIDWIYALNELSKRGDPSLEAIITGHKKGDVYRLPTEHEWNFVTTVRGKHNEEYFWGTDETVLEDYAWHSGNTDKLQAVATRKPIIVEGKEFFDMHGLVKELVIIKVEGRPWYQHMGDSWQSALHNLGYYAGINHQNDAINYRFDDEGFRLVREVRP